MRSRTVISLATAAAASAPALAQPYAIVQSTMSPGGTTPATSPNFGLSGIIGQFDAGPNMSGPTYSVAGGFINPASSPPPPGCYANCDGSTFSPVLNVNDFTCFVNAFAAQASYANCDQSTIPPTLNVNDFFCFLNRYAVGCP